MTDNNNNWMDEVIYIKVNELEKEEEFSNF